MLIGYDVFYDEYYIKDDGELMPAADLKYYCDEFAYDFKKNWQETIDALIFCYSKEGFFDREKCWGRSRVLL